MAQPLYLLLKTAPHKNEMTIKKNVWYPISKPNSDASSNLPKTEYPKVEKVDYGEVLKKYQEEWRKKLMEEHPNDNQSIKFPMDIYNHYHWLYLSLITASVSITSYYLFINWDTIYPIISKHNIHV